MCFLPSFRFKFWEFSDSLSDSSAEAWQVVFPALSSRACWLWNSRLNDGREQLSHIEVIKLWRRIELPDPMGGTAVRRGPVRHVKWVKHVCAGQTSPDLRIVDEEQAVAQAMRAAAAVPCSSGQVSCDGSGNAPCADDIASCI